jgi:hypothetical protein
MDIGQRVITLDGSAGIIVSLDAGVARICYLTPDDRLSYIAATHLLANLKAAPAAVHRSLAA